MSTCFQAGTSLPVGGVFGRCASPVGAAQAAKTACRDRSLPSLRRFWAVAASRNSSLAPFGPGRHRDMRLDLPFLDEPGEIRRRSVSTIRSEPLRFEPEALSGPIKHGARRADLGLSDGAGRFYVQD